MAQQQQHYHHHHHHIHPRRHPKRGDGKGKNANAPVPQVDNQVATLVSVVYVTAAQTFEGSVGSYMTLGVTSADAPAAQSVTSDTPAPLPVTSDTPAAAPTSNAADSSAAAISSALVGSLPTDTGSSNTAADTTSSPLPRSTATSLLQSILTASPSAAGLTTATSGVSSSALPVDAASASHSSSNADPATVSKSSNGMSGGAKAGVAIGVILGLAALLGLLAFCHHRRRQQQNEAYERPEDEKNPFGDNAAAAAPAPPRATTPPQLSLRPVTQFEPEFMGQKPPTSTGLTAGATTQARDLEKAQPQVENPFGHNAELAQNGSEIPAPLRVGTPTSESTGPIAGAALGVGVTALAGAATANLAQRHNAPKPLDIKRTVSPTPQPIEGAMPSPTGTEFSMTSVSTSTMTHGAPPTNVHRIQLDFKPSMADEIELKAGQLIRLLHEYDDGWALCIRLDRSQQGVAPRTCLSTRPVKPRSKPPPRGPPMPVPRLPIQTAMGPPNRAASPGPPGRAPRSMSPAPLGASPQRSMSPGPYGGGPQQSMPPLGGKRRSNSAGDVRARCNSPPGPSPMNPNASSIAQGFASAQKPTSTRPTATSPTTTSRPQTSSGVQRKPVPVKAT